MNSDLSLRQHLVDLLEGGHSHLPVHQALAGWSEDARGSKPPGIAHSAWELLEHMRIAQWDILRFSVSADHVSPDFPDGYWPASAAPPDPGDWVRSIEQLESDLKKMQALVSDPSTDLYARIPHGKGQTVLREALTLASHNSYHTAQLVMLGKLVGK